MTTDLETFLNTAKRQASASKTSKVNAAWVAAKNGEYAKFCKEVDEKTAKAIAKVQADCAKVIEDIKADAEAQKQAKEAEVQGQIAAQLNSIYDTVINGLDDLISKVKDSEGGV